MWIASVIDVYNELRGERCYYTDTTSFKKTGSPETLMNKAFQRTTKNILKNRLVIFSKITLPEIHPGTGFYHEKKFLLNQEYYL